jgi:hypothetical protein
MAIPHKTSFPSVDIEAEGPLGCYNVQLVTNSQCYEGMTH